MKPVAVIASAAVSALGRGRAAYDVGEVGELPKSALALHPAFEGLRYPLLGRVAIDETRGVDRAERLLEMAVVDLTRELDLAVPGWKGLRVGVVLGTSSGAMQSIELALRVRSEGQTLTRDAGEAASYFSPLRAIRMALGDGAPIVQVLAACASSTIAIGLGCRLLEAERYELVIAGGYDALSGLVAAGFDALKALTASVPRPFREGRDGMALGEGAGLLALRLADGSPRTQGLVLGFGASSDAFHVTAPDPNGAGLERAARAALADAATAPARIGLVSAHGTGTPFNDSAEARALASVFGPEPIPVFPFKAVIGHTLGAAGVLETLAAFDALSRACLPAVPNGTDPPSEGHVYLPRMNEARTYGRVLKLSAAFGGANAALVLGKKDEQPASSARVRRPVAMVLRGPFVDHAVPELIARFARVDGAILSRVDGLSELALSASAELLERLSETPGPDTAVVVATIAATLEQDELFDVRRRARLAVEPRRFPATSPNLAAGWCGIAFGFQGPAFVVGGPSAPSDALVLAHELVAAGDARAALVVLVEDAGHVVNDLFRAAGRLVPRRGGRALLLREAGDLAATTPSELSWTDFP